MTGRIESAPAAERYFCTLSPLCKRIISNVQTIRSIHADEWQHLSYADQCDVIDGHMVNQDTAEHWRRLSRQPGDGAPSSLGSTASAKLVEDEDPETGQVVRWRDEHAAPFSWRTPSQERVAAEALATEGDCAGRQTFLVRDSIRNRLSRVEHMYESFSPKRTVGDGFDSPALVLGGSSGSDGEGATAAGKASLKQSMMSRLARGRRVLLSITKLGKPTPAVAEQPRRLEISSPEMFVHTAGCTPPELGPPVPRQRPPPPQQPEPTSPAGSPTTSGRPLSSSASFRRLQKPSSPPPPVPVQCSLVPIRTSAAHRQSLRGSGQQAPPPQPQPPSPPPPTAGAPRPQPTPPQLKRVRPPMVPVRRDSLTPERRADGDGSERACSREEELPPPPAEWRFSGPRESPPPRESGRWQGEGADLASADVWRQPALKPEPRTLTSQEPRTLTSQEPLDGQESAENAQPPSEPGRRTEPCQEEEEQPRSGEDSSYLSIIEQPSEVGIKTGFDFLDNW